MFSIFLVVFLSLHCDAFDPRNYQCSYCLGTFDKVQSGMSLNEACSIFPDNFCGAIKSSNLDLIRNLGEKDSRSVCRALKFCPMNAVAAPSANVDAGLDIRVSKALGSKGYNKLRISVVSNKSFDDELFSYSSSFKYRWTGKYLSTGVVTVNPGEKNKISIAGKEIDIFLPKEGDGVRGIIIADPCFTSDWIYCGYANKFQTFNHTIEFLNAIGAYNDVHYYQILGDNFYDQAGDASALWFQSLSTEMKTKFFSTVPGNHDFWVNASPKLWVPKDQLGSGFMQFYGQDTVGSIVENNDVPFDFSVDPDGKNKGSENLPPASNFFFYNKVGNVAFIGYSGAHSFASMQQYFKDACNWATESKPDVVLLLGHWNNDGDGCTADATTPFIYNEISTLKECAAIAPKMRYFMGHQHCNQVTQKDVGFMVGALGMSDSSSCGGVFGIPIVDTTGGDFKVYYFALNQVSEGGKEAFDHYDEILNCVKSSGISKCYHLATLWSSVPLLSMV